MLLCREKTRPHHLLHCIVECCCNACVLLLDCPYNCSESSNALLLRHRTKACIVFHCLSHTMQGIQPHTPCLTLCMKTGPAHTGSRCTCVSVARGFNTDTQSFAHPHRYWTKERLPSITKMKGVAAWGGVALAGALFVVQPW